jgi:hypothetical protein
VHSELKPIRVVSYAALAIAILALLFGLRGRKKD